jgi:hypothetical protein
MCYKKEVEAVAKQAIKQFIEHERKLTTEQKTFRLAAVSFGIASYAALKAMKTSREMKRRLRKCEKRLQKIEDKDFT